MCAAAGAISCGEENEPVKPPAEFARGVELLAAHGIVAGAYWVQFYDPPLMLDGAHVGGFVSNLYQGIIALERNDACLANMALLHELAHLAQYRKTNTVDYGHEQADYWSAVYTANAEWRSEICQ